MRKKILQFYISLILRLFRDIFTLKEVKQDIERFPDRINKTKEVNKFSRLRENLNRFLYHKFYFKKFYEFIKVFEVLEDKYSKKILIELISGRMLGFDRVKLFLNNAKYWRVKELVKNMIQGEDFIKIGDWVLNYFDLNKIKFPIKLFDHSLGILNTFFIEQYSYKHKKMIVAEEGDTVIDAGGCWGDSALYFASKVKNRGRIYTFEFIPSNVDIFKKNLNLNPDLKDLIQLIELPLWKTSNCELFFIDKGPGSYTRFKHIKNFTAKIKTITIDDFLEQNNITKVDFIKMDIEGTELDALIGTKNALIKYRPKLAISIYHNINHFFEIPKFINKLNLNYKFFMDHFTTHGEETILFAIVD